MNLFDYAKGVEEDEEFLRRFKETVQGEEIDPCTLPVTIPETRRENGEA